MVVAVVLEVVVVVVVVEGVGVDAVVIGVVCVARIGARIRKPAMNLLTLEPSDLTVCADAAVEAQIRTPFVRAKCLK